MDTTPGHKEELLFDEAQEPNDVTAVCSSPEPVVLRMPTKLQPLPMPSRTNSLDGSPTDDASAPSSLWSETPVYHTPQTYAGDMTPNLSHNDVFINLPDARKIYEQCFETKVIRQETDRWPPHSSQKGPIEVFRSLISLMVNSSGSALVVHAPLFAIRMLTPHCQFCDGGRFQKEMQTHGVTSVDHADFLKYFLQFNEPAPTRQRPPNSRDRRVRGHSACGGFCISSSGAICLAGVKFLTPQKSDISWPGASPGQLVAFSVAQALGSGIVIYRSAAGSFNIVTAFGAQNEIVYHADRQQALRFANHREAGRHITRTISEDFTFGTLSESYLKAPSPHRGVLRRQNTTEVRREASFRRGISFVYIRDYLLSDAIEDTGKENPTMREWLHCAGSRFAGNDATAPHGENIECPRDEKLGCALVDAMDSAFTGPITHYLSWTYDSHVVQFVSGITLWFENSGAAKFQDDEVFIWCCMFCNNQYRIIRQPATSEMRDYLLEAFNERLEYVRDNPRASMIVLLETWKDPVYIKRIWCLWEIFMAKHLGVTMEFALAKDEVQHFRSALHAGYAQIPQAVESIDVTLAEAYDPEDRRAILEQIERSIGCAAVNDVIKTFLIGWFADEFKKLLEGKDSSRDGSM